MMYKANALFIPILVLLFWGHQTAFSQQFSSSPDVWISAGTVGYDTIDVIGVADINNFHGLFEVCVSLEIVIDAGTCGMDPHDEIYLALETPDTVWTLSALSSFPNGVSSLVNTCFTWCPSFDFVETTTDNTPFTSTYDAYEEFDHGYFADRLANGSWVLEVMTGCIGDSVHLTNWNFRIGPSVPEAGTAVFIDPTCPGDDDGEIHIPLNFSGHCLPTYYSIDTGLTFSGLLSTDSIFTGLLADTNYQVWVEDPRHLFASFSYPYSLYDDDFEDPIITNPPADITLFTSDDGGGDCYFQYDFELPFATDNCGLAPDMLMEVYFPPIDLTPDISTIAPPGTAESIGMPVGESLIIFYIEDDSGNYAECEQYVYVVDDEYPVIMCNDFPAPNPNDMGMCSAFLTKMVPQPIDNCIPTDWQVNVQISYADGGYEEFNELAGNTYDRDFPVGTTTIMYSYTDIGGNMASCSEAVLVTDTELPVISCPSDVTIGTSTLPDTCAGEIYIIHPSVSDNCGVASLLLTYEGPGGLVANVMVSADAELPLILLEGVTNIEYEVFDESGNSEFCGYNIEVVDDTPPEWEGVVPTMLVGECPNDNLQSLLDANLPVISDDCQSSSYDIVSDITVPSCGMTIEGTVGLILIDDLGNESIDTSYINYLLDDTTPPEIIFLPAQPADATVNCDEPLPSLPVVNASDGCDGSIVPVLTVDTTLIDCDPTIVALYAYTWMATDACGNASTATWTVSVTNNFDVTLTDENGTILPDQLILCNGASISLETSVTLPDAEYSWSTGEATSTVTISQAGIYSVTVTTPGGCCASDEIEINTDGEIIASITQSEDFVCGVTAVTLEAISSPPADSYEWSNGATSSSIEITASGLYSVTVTSILGCTASAEIDIQDDMNAPQDILIVGGDLSCANASVTLIGSSSTDGVTYAWRKLPDGDTSFGPNYIVSTTGDYELTVTGPNNCSAVATTTVGGATSIAVIEFDVNTITCSMHEVQIQLLNVDPGSVFMWTDPDGMSFSNDQNPLVSVGGAYEVYVVDLNQCDTVLEVFVPSDTILPEAIASASPSDTITCIHPEITLEGISNGLTGQWTDEQGMPLSGGNFTNVSSPGQYKFTVVNTINGCVNSDSISILLDNESPVIGSLTFEIDCDRGAAAILLDLHPINVDYLWSGPNFSSTDSIPLVSDPGVYMVTITDKVNGCSSTTSAEFIKGARHADVQIATYAATNGFNGVAWYIVRAGIEPISIEWFNGADNTSLGTADTIYNVPAGKHYMLVEDGNGCVNVVDWLLGAEPTICDYAATPVASETLVEDALLGVRLAPASFNEQMCVEEVFGTPISDAIYLSTYIYESTAEPVNLEYLSADFNTSRAFIFTCEQFLHFNRDTCVNYTPASNPGMVELNPSEPFYYIVIAGLNASEYSFIIHSQDTLTICESVDQNIECGVPQATTVSGADRFNFLNQDNSAYGQCYRGDREYTGPEKVFKLHVDFPSMTVFHFEAETDMGVFVYDYQCAKRCISYFETDAMNKVVSDSLTLNAGDFYIVVDKDRNEADKSFMLEIECMDLEDFPWPDRRQAECYSEDLDTAQLIQFTTNSFSFGEDVLPPNGAQVLLYLLNPEGNRKIGPGVRISSTASSNVYAYADILEEQDSTVCGYLNGDEIVFRLKNESKAEIIFCTPGYSDDNNGNFLRASTSEIDSFYQTPNTQIYVSSIGPYEHASVPFDSTTVSFSVEANQSWHLDLPDGKDWVTGSRIRNGIDSLQGLGNSLVTIELKKNSTPESRKATVRVFFDNAMTIIEFKITQNYCDKDSDDCEMIVATTGVDLSRNIQVFPNPNSGTFFVEYAFGVQLKFNIAVYDLLGNKVFNRNGLRGETGNEQLNLTDLPNGIYLVQIQSEGHNVVRKIVLQH